VPGKHGRLEGFERFLVKRLSEGRPKPSEALLYIFLENSNPAEDH
jgi:hypothetical protein